MTNEQLIIHYFATNKVENFWADSAMQWIRSVLAGNRHFVKEVSNPKLRTRDGRVQRFECDAIAIAPDSGKEVKARIIYTFTVRGLSGKHHVELKVA
jgi:hypothetical protein